MESDWIFVYNQRPSLPAAEEIAEIIQCKDGKPVGWYEIEAILAENPEVNPKDCPLSMLIAHTHQLGLFDDNPLSGVIEFPESEPFLLEEIRILIPIIEYALPFSMLRTEIWGNTDNLFWPELQIRWDIDRFIGRMFLLNHKMESIYLIT